MFTPIQAARSNTVTGAIPRRNSQSSARHRQSSDDIRHGVAVVEVAICLPVMLLVTLLFIEFTNLIFLQQSLKVASYEGIRVAAKQGTDLANVTDICSSVLDGREVVSYEVSVEPEDFTTVERGTLITVTIEANKADNQLFDLLLGTSSTMEVQSFGLKE